MRSEQLRDVRPTWVAFGWFAAVSVAGLALVILVSLGLLSRNSDDTGGWMVLSFVVGFFSGGWLVGWRTGAAPVLHGVGIGLFSLVVWLVLNLVAQALGLPAWIGLTAKGGTIVLLAQVGSAVAGAWYGARHHAVDTA